MSDAIGVPVWITADVIQKVSTAVGREVSEHELEGVMRRNRSLRPRVVSGRRLWSEEDVQRVSLAFLDKESKKEEAKGRRERRKREVGRKGKDRLRGPCSLVHASVSQYEARLSLAIPKQSVWLTTKSERLTKEQWLRKGRCFSELSDMALASELRKLMDQLERVGLALHTKDPVRHEGWSVIVDQARSGRSEP